MPRKREDIIRESLEELQDLELRYRGKPEGPRVAMLLHLKQDPDLQMEEVALHVGFSLSAVKRWLRTYRAGGMNALLQKRIGGRPEAAIDPGLNRLKKKLVAGDFSRLGEVEQWLEEYRHSQRPRRIVQSTNGIIRKNGVLDGVEERKAVPPGSVDERQEIGIEYLSGFFSSVSKNPDTSIWGNSIKEALKNIFPDVDHMTLVVNIRCDIFNPDAPRSSMAITQTTKEMWRVQVDTISGDPAKKADEPVVRQMKMLKARDFPFKDYRAPSHFVFFLNKAYLGLITFWQKRGKPPISRETLAGMEKLRPMLMYLFSDFVARYRAAQPMEFVLSNVTAAMREMFDLTMQEERILTLQLIGMSYEEIGNQLNITINTVRSHIKSIYTKAGAHSTADFYAKYFSPLLKDEKRRS